MDNADLIRAASIIAHGGDLSEEELAERLIADGFAESTAYRLAAFLPSAFARPVLEELGVTDFAPACVVTEDGAEIRVFLEDQPEYCAALALARAHRETGTIPPEVYRAIVNGTAEIDAISNALNDGMDIEGAVVVVALNSSTHARHVVRRRPWWRLW